MVGGVDQPHLAHGGARELDERARLLLRQRVEDAARVEALGDDGLQHAQVAGESHAK